MFRAWTHLILVVMTLSTVQFTQVDAAFCAKCRKIEAERANEQTEHPKKVGYYDDYLKEKADAEEVQKSPEAAKAEQAKLAHNDDYGVEKNSQGANQKSKEIAYVDIAQAEPPKQPKKANSYSTLFAILKTRDFLETLDGTFTFFVPTNEAFQQLPPGTLEDLAKPENQEKLSALVSNHLLPMKLLYKDFIQKNDQQVKALSGHNLTLHANKGHLSVEEAHVLSIEPAGFDGVIYLIDRVLVPKE